MKGLPYSRRRGSAILQPVTKIKKSFKETFTVTNAAPGYGTAVIAGLPQSNVLLLGLTMYLKLTKGGAGIIDAFDGDYSLGTIPNANNALADAEIDLLASTAFAAAAVGGVTGVMRSASASSLAGTIFDNTDGSLEVNLNLLVDDASISADASMLAEGTLFMAYITLGDD